jgi:TonB-dependent starch-binding outer membrane protein SusC
VVDGTPIQSGTGGLLFLNPSDISEIEVLKDAAQTAMYGVQGANGVVLITTKTAKKR